MFLWNLLLAMIWTAVTGRVTPVNLAVGFLVGYLALWIVRPAVGPSTYFTKAPQTVGLLLFFLWELILANLRIAYEVVTRTHHMRPGVIGIPLRARTDMEITLLANMITLTPGTLSLDVSADRQVLYIHAMYADDVDAVRRRIQDGFERRLLAVLR